MSRIFLPLRSNSGWFVDQAVRNELEYRIKNCILYYDEIIIQDGRYIYRGGETGNFDIFLPANQAGSDRSKLDICKTGNDFGITIGGEKVIWGTAEVAYETDFYPIFQNAGVLEKDYIQLLPTDIPEKGKRSAQELASIDIEAEELKKHLPMSYFQQKNIIDSLYIDALFSYIMKIPFLTDYRMAPVIQWKNKNIGINFEKTTENLFLNAWVSIGLPDFGELPWPKIIELRESKAGQDFRRMVSKISNVMKDSYSEVTEQVELQLIVQQLLSQELVIQLRAKLPNPKTAFFNLGLNLIPWGGGIVLGGGKDLKDLIDKRNSWVSFLEIENTIRK